MGSPILWVGFNLFVLLALALDLGVFHRKAHKIKFGEAAFGSALWISLALIFGWCVWHWNGEQRGLEWGILGALVMRGIMIATGAVLVARFQWILPAFGVFLVYTGLHMLWKRDKSVHYEKNPIFRFASSHLRVTKEYRGERFFLKDGGQLFATPLFLVLLIVEITDVTFAVDSIPAIFGITRDPFIVYTSNVFAILGLRALYFLLADVLDYFHYLGIGLALVLMFIGGKMVADPWVHISVVLSLGAVGGTLLLAMLISVLTRPVKKKKEPGTG